MGCVLERLPYGGRVALIRLRSLGDCVLTTPALELLKDTRPDLKIAVVVEDRFRAVFERNPAVHEILGPGPLQIAAARADLCVNLHGGTRSMMLALASRARLRAGFAHYRGQAAYNIRIPRAQQILGEERVVHTAEHLASAMFFLGVERQPIPPARLFGPAEHRTQPYAVLHPFASSPRKRWPLERFAAIARELLDRGLKPVVLSGPGENPAVLPGVETVKGLALAHAIALIRSAAVFIGNDSGPAHVAAACGTPLIVLFGASDPEMWAPWKAAAIQIARPSMREISVGEVSAAIDGLKVHA